MTAIFIFTRDLRLEDNIPLISALKNNQYVLPIFIFNPQQITDKNTYKSNNSIQFMIESLDELNKDLQKQGSRLFYFYGEPNTILKKIINESDKYEIKSIYISMDYTEFAKKREKELAKFCKQNDLELYVMENHMLTGFDKVKKNDGTFYKKFTPYYRVAIKLNIDKPIKNNKKNYIPKSYKFSSEFKKDIHDFYEPNDDILVRGGRSNAIKILKKIKEYKDYNISREIPAIRGTTYLSAYIKFNVVSIREVYEYFTKNLSKNNHLITQLFWRDFYTQILANFKVLKTPMNEHYIEWENNPTFIKKWKDGETGIPIVDAGMRQMNITGWMHNRVRMITSNFLVKILRCDWIIGEKYFAQTLVDYDVGNNNGGWQWSAGTGADSQPYFRVFSPWRQAESYDPDCLYIKKWIPELADVPVKDILNWNEKWVNYRNISYPKPIVENIQDEFKKTLKLYKK